MESVFTLVHVALHSFVTAPSLVVHSVNNLWLRKFYKQQMSLNAPRDGVNVLLFVHGRLGSVTDFLPLIANLQLQTGRCQPANKLLLEHGISFFIQSVDLGNTANTSLIEDAQTLKAHIEQFYHNCALTLVGLSKGGLVIVQYALDQGLSTDANNNRIDKLITLGAPLRGTRCAALFPTASSVFQNLAQEGKCVQEIVQHRLLPSLKMFHMVPTWDNLVIPASSAQYECTDTSRVWVMDTFMYGHCGIAYNPMVARTLLLWLYEHD